MKFTMMVALGLLVACGGTIRAETEEAVIDMPLNFVAYLDSQGVQFGFPAIDPSVEYKIDAIRGLLRAGRFEEGHQQLLPLHRDGVAAASMLLGMMYANGDHVGRDIERAE